MVGRLVCLLMIVERNHASKSISIVEIEQHRLGIDSVLTLNMNVFFQWKLNGSKRDILANALYYLSWKLMALKWVRNMLNAHNLQQTNKCVSTSFQIRSTSSAHHMLFYHSHLKIDCRKVCLSLVALANTVYCFVLEENRRAISFDVRQRENKYLARNEYQLSI